MSGREGEGRNGKMSYLNYEDEKMDERQGLRLCLWLCLWMWLSLLPTLLLDTRSGTMGEPSLVSTI